MGHKYIGYTTKCASDCPACARDLTQDMLALLQELAETVPMSIQQRTKVDAVIRKATGDSND